MSDTTTETPAAQEPRKVRDIAAEIDEKWKQPYYGAVPYIEAMRTLDTPQDRYLHEEGEGIIRRFLVNASRWRGDDARRIKAELKAMVGM
jgi:hypothetical protein